MFIKLIYLIGATSIDLKSLYGCVIYIPFNLNIFSIVFDMRIFIAHRENVFFLTRL